MRQDVIIDILYPRSPIHQRESTASVRSKALNGIKPSLERQEPPTTTNAVQRVGNPEKQGSGDKRPSPRTKRPFPTKRLPDCSIYRHALFHIQYSAAYSTVNVFGIPSQLLGGWPPAVLTLNTSSQPSVALTLPNFNHGTLPFPLPFGPTGAPSGAGVPATFANPPRPYACSAVSMSKKGVVRFVK